MVLEVNDNLWFGTFAGDRIAITKANDWILKKMVDLPDSNKVPAEMVIGNISKN